MEGHDHPPLFLARVVVVAQGQARTALERVISRWREATLPLGIELHVVGHLAIGQAPTRSKESVTQNMEIQAYEGCASTSERYEDRSSKLADGTLALLGMGMRCQRQHPLG